MTTEERIQAVGRRIVEGYAPDGISLFDSYAYGVPHEHSDLNLLLLKEKAEEKRVERSIKGRQLLGGTDFPAMDILIHPPAEMKKAVGIFQSAETFAATKGQFLYAA